MPRDEVRGKVRKRGSLKAVGQLLCGLYSVTAREPWKVSEEEG